MSKRPNLRSGLLLNVHAATIWPKTGSSEHMNTCLSVANTDTDVDSPSSNGGRRQKVAGRRLAADGSCQW